MTIQDLGSAGEFVAAIATVATLAYLALQIRLTREQSRLDSELHLTDQMSRHTEQMARDPDLARIVELANTDPGKLTEDERRRVMWWQVSFLHMIEGLFRRYEQGRVSRDAWAPYERSLAGLFATDFLPTWWATDMSRLYTDSFRAYIERELSDVEDRWSHTRASAIASGSNAAGVDPTAQG